MRITNIIFCFVCIFCFSVTNADAEKLLRAEFFSHTNDDNKDFDSGVSVEVRTNDRKTLLAEVSAGDATKEYKDNADNELALVIKSEGSTIKSCDKFKFRVGMKPNGNDTWKFNGKVTLYFDNGKTIVQDIGYSVLKSEDTLTWTEWAGGK